MQKEGSWRLVKVIFGVSPLTGLLIMMPSLSSISVVKSSVGISQSQSMLRLTFSDGIDQAK